MNAVGGSQICLTIELWRKPQVKPASLLQHLIVCNFVSLLHVSVTILDVVLCIGQSDTDLTPGGVRHERPPRTPSPDTCASASS